MPYHEISKLTGKEEFYWCDWVKFWKYQHTPQQAVSWWIAWCFFYGSILFLLGACSSLSHQVCEPASSTWLYVPHPQEDMCN